MVKTVTIGVSRAVRHVRSQVRQWDDVFSSKRRQVAQWSGMENGASVPAFIFCSDIVSPATGWTVAFSE